MSIAFNWVRPNRRRGDVVATINGRPRILRLSLAALAQVESCYGDMDILELVHNFAQHGMTNKDADNIIRAGLSGCNDNTAHDEVLELADATALAHNLIESAFHISV